MKELPSPLRDPWAISEEGMHLVLSIWSREQLFPDELSRARELLAAEGRELRKGSRAAEVRDGVSVISIRGPLFRHAGLLSLSGATSYAQIGKDLEAALADDEVCAILLQVDSPGGEASGVQELATRIRAADQKKPVLAYVEGAGASAAYWLSAAAREIVAAPTAFLGSIGVRITVPDDSAARMMRGEREIEIISSVSPDKRSTPVDGFVARLQQRADALAAVFVADVARLRGVSEEKVLKDFGRGDVLMGQAAVAAGLADRLGSFDALFLDLRRRPTPSPRIAPPTAKNARPKPSEDRKMSLSLKNLIALCAGLSGALSACGDDPELKEALGPHLEKARADLQTADPKAEVPVLQDLLSLRETVVECTGEKVGLVGAVKALKSNAEEAVRLSEQARVKVLVGEMVADGQIGPSERTHYEAYSLADAQAARRLLRKDPPQQVPAVGAGPIDEKQDKQAEVRAKAKALIHGSKGQE